MKKYVIVGAGIRGLYMYAIPIIANFSDVAMLVGVLDTNRKRSELLKQESGGEFHVYFSFDEMLKSSQPDIVIITTVDRFHCEYIVKALDFGCNVIVEKPMAIDVSQCKEILRAEKRSGRSVIVTFNLRFAPFSTRLKELVKKEKAVGEVLSLHFEWFLDTDHGADYFRRWHRKKENSGGLLVHKATHHFDLVNWMIEEEPVSVNAFGSLRFYGPNREERGIRCLDCMYKKSCEYFFDINLEPYRKMYLECEDADGYIRDGCVFSDDINIEDSAAVNVKYSGGAVMSYSLTAHSPYEGYRLVINGTRGRLEAENFHGAVGPFKGEYINRIRLYNRKEEEINLRLPIPRGEHGGGDEKIQDMLFRGSHEERLGFIAGSRDGAMSILTGIAANLSIKEGRPIRIKDLINLSAESSDHSI